MSIAAEMMQGEIQYYLDEMALFNNIDLPEQTQVFKQEQQGLKVCSLQDTDFERYKRWKELDEKARKGTEAEMEKLMPEMFDIVDLNGDGEIDRCELAKECHGAWGLSEEQCIEYAMEQYPLEKDEVAQDMFRVQELGF